METVFSGRVLFDHLEKTAGQALNAWLRTGLGRSAVTEPLIGTHRELIKLWGGDYSVIFGHVQFDGTGLDPRYRYVTVLRDPVERALSHLFFILNNHAPDSLPEWRSYERFLLSEGEVVDYPVLSKLVNYHVDHFASAESRLHRPAIARLEEAQGVLDRYAVWGFHDRLPEFIGDLAGFLGLPAPRVLAPVNVTMKKPRANQISAKLRARLEELNALDLTFYRVAQDRYEAARAAQVPVVRRGQSAWTPYDCTAARPGQGPDLSLLSVAIDRADGIVPSEAELVFRLEIELARDVSEMIAGIHIHSEDGWLAFGTNSALLEHPLRNLAAGRHSLDYRVGASLPQGRYRAGFAFQEPASDGMRTLAWQDRALFFEVRIERQVPSIGACALKASLSHDAIATSAPAGRGWMNRLRETVHLSRIAGE
ncbi:MAG TPA: Wzt carbohydrate-binding domain-containing protein [Magnetospirillaceae bacterium]|nr:Wzt carbohydrate-binding domain-containing protein [Magnetospirillaceae bacterium]